MVSKTTLAEATDRELISVIASISSAVVHPAGIVVASSSGQRTFVDFEDASRDGYEPDMVSARGYDNTLKLWAL